jgi:hypothetical protein
MRISIKKPVLFFIIAFSLVLPEHNLAGLTNKLSDRVRCDLKFELLDTTGWKWADSLDAVKAAPGSHKVLFENEKIRILEVTVDPYGFEPMHTHRYPSVMFGPDNDTSHYNIIYYKYDYDSSKHVYFAKDSALQHGGGHAAQFSKAHFMNPEGPHRIKNLSNARIVAFRVEFKQ